MKATKGWALVSKGGRVIVGTSVTSREGARMESEDWLSNNFNWALNAYDEPVEDFWTEAHRRGWRVVRVMVTPDESVEDQS